MFQPHSQTSMDAYWEKLPKLNKLERAIYEHLVIMKDSGATGDELAILFDIAPGTASARCRDLQLKKLIKKSEFKRKTRANVNANIWKLPQYVDEEADSKSDQSYTDEDGNVWQRPSARTYATVARQLRKAEAEIKDLKEQIARSQRII